MRPEFQEANVRLEKYQTANWRFYFSAWRERVGAMKTEHQNLPQRPSTALTGAPGLASRGIACEPRPRPVVECSDCGASFVSTRPWAQFCGNACRKRFHNRKLARAAIAVDLLMAWRFDRAAFEAVGGRALLSRVVAGFRREDQRDRAGRRSWDAPRAAKQRAARFLSVVVGRGVAGTKSRRGRSR
jgi:hypothetical protein